MNILKVQVSYFQIKNTFFEGDFWNLPHGICDRLKKSNFDIRSFVIDVRLFCCLFTKKLYYKMITSNPSRERCSACGFWVFITVSLDRSFKRA